MTGIATLNEAALPGIWHALEDAGLHVPRDVSIAGVAARQWAEDFRPPLTSADVPAQPMGTQAVELLVERIAAPDTPPRHILLTPPISLRASTGPATPPSGGTPGDRSRPWPPGASPRSPSRRPWPAVSETARGLLVGPTGRSASQPLRCPVGPVPIRLR
ncbi:hypothetical protein ABH925_006426 [Streptacidiphilus sp. EB129]